MPELTDPAPSSPEVTIALAEERLQGYLKDLLAREKGLTPLGLSGNQLAAADEKIDEVRAFVRAGLVDASSMSEPERRKLLRDALLKMNSLDTSLIAIKGGQA